MKNNKIFNRTFKVSLVAMALGLVCGVVTIFA